ncbi:hypothetical protein B0T25DRAFT_544621 [Lasiosphaeria hispida]|uniref:Uncharacterized protein n=1 Tax=Lasiosphaeria hispida TaxID=260671 RepID=A0AAJ0MEG9_9PEZI|nr:hypothetical protein B0T25DRAFT_544621 [Lasiosphaeria hispida]
MLRGLLRLTLANSPCSGLWCHAAQNSGIHGYWQTRGHGRWYLRSWRFAAKLHSPLAGLLELVLTPATLKVTKPGCGWPVIKLVPLANAVQPCLMLPLLAPC